MELVLAALIIGADFISKIWVKNNLPYGRSLTIWPKILNFHYTHNTGAAFSILRGQRIFLTFLSLLATVGLLLYRKKIIEEQKPMAVVYALILGGTVGNLIDRLFYGYVIDFLEFGFISFPVFNLADAALTGGVTLMVLLIVTQLFRGGLK